MGIEPTPSAWKAEVLPLNYTRWYPTQLSCLVEGVGFEPTKAKPSDLQSDPVDRLGTPPTKIEARYFQLFGPCCQLFYTVNVRTPLRHKI
jgi:hypothetical protein